MNLENHRTAKEMWDYLQKCYVQESGALLYTLMQQIHTLEQGDMSIDEYYSAFDRLMGPLISMIPQCSSAKCTTQMFIEKFFTYRFVMGVRPEFESIRSRLLHGSTLTMAHALSDLLTEETRLQSMSTSHMTSPHNVLAAYRSGSKSNDNSSDPCVHCQKTNHRTDDCFIKYPEKLAAFHAHRAFGLPPGNPSLLPFLELLWLLLMFLLLSFRFLSHPPLLHLGCRLGILDGFGLRRHHNSRIATLLVIY
jgi:hypothetical protein